MEFDETCSTTSFVMKGKINSLEVRILVDFAIV
jgi:hypothetical protein